MRARCSRSNMPMTLCILSGVIVSASAPSAAPTIGNNRASRCFPCFAPRRVTRYNLFRIWHFVPLARFAPDCVDCRVAAALPSGAKLGGVVREEDGMTV